MIRFDRRNTIKQGGGSSQLDTEAHGLQTIQVMWLVGKKESEMRFPFLHAVVAGLLINRKVL